MLRSPCQEPTSVDWTEGKEPQARAYPDRVIGRVLGTEPGPTLVWIGGIHGNEPAGVRAVERLFAALPGRESRVRGEILGLTGNRAALAAGRRFLDRDLNRIWSRERVEGLHGGRLAPVESPEDRELVELWTELEAAFARARGPVHIVDFHTTSGAGRGFAVIPDTLHSRAFAMHLPVPSVLGIEEEIEGTVADYLGERGFVVVGFEGGQHDDPVSVDRCEAAAWISLAASGVIDADDLPELASASGLLHRMTEGVPHFLEVRYRHAISPEDRFRMDPGFENFQPVRQGDRLAEDGRGEIRAPSTGRILMPLYQAQGEDGFFVVRGFQPLWLRVSALLRRMGAARLVLLLPGVSRSPDDPDTLIVDRRVARWFAMEIFHLLGYRRHRLRGDYLFVTRRPQRYKP